MRLYKWLIAGHPPENLSEIIAAAPTMRTDHLTTDAWELEADDVIALRRKLSAGGKRLAEFCDNRIFRGLITGLTEVFVIDGRRRAALVADDPRSADIIKPFVQGTHVRPWYTEDSGEFLIAIRSSANHQWPWSNAGDGAEDVFKQTYPAVHSYLNQSRDQAIKRQDQGRFWWELRACAYWDIFEQPKIVWPDISKLPRFSLDLSNVYLSNTVYTMPLNDGYLLGILSSWTTWFFISKTAQPLRLRGDRWQYRLFTQFMDSVPIPDGAADERRAIGDLAKRCCTFGRSQYELRTKVQERIVKSFGEGPTGEVLGKLNQKAQAWWEVSLNDLGAALKTSFKLPSNPLKSPRIADEWEPYLAEKRAEHERLGRSIADAESEINERVVRLFNLTPAEATLLMREVEH